MNWVNVAGVLSLLFLCHLGSIAQGYTLDGQEDSGGFSHWVKLSTPLVSSARFKWFYRFVAGSDEAFDDADYMQALRDLFNVDGVGVQK